MPVEDYSTDPNSNTEINGINVAEGCAPGNINNAIRQLMADVADGLVQYYAQAKTSAQKLIARQNIGLGNVDDTSDANKPVSTATQTALNGKVDTSDSRLTNAREWTATTVSQAEAEAGTATTRRAWTAQRVRQAISGALNVAGAAPIYGCRAWVNFDGSSATPVIRASGNVSGVTRPSSGRYVVTLTEAMPDADYAVSVTANSGAEFSARVTAQTATTITIEVMGDFSNRQNPSIISAAVFG